MHIAVIQHLLTGDDSQDAVELANAAADAGDFGADVVVFPRVPVLANLSDGDPVVKIFEAIGETRREDVLYINPAAVSEGAHVALLPRLGQTALFIGDACMDAQEILTVSGKKPAVAILAPGAENDLQAEAMAEYALGLSSSLAGLVVIAEATGADPGAAGHGGSAIIALGEVVAEAMGGGTEALNAEVASPIPQPEPRELLPTVPTILSQRLSHHLGEKPQVDYPADLS
jgi:hypothetical protein